MSAPCKLTKEGTAECLCPVFWGHFQLVSEDAQFGPFTTPANVGSGL